jgi:hypothetical protein
MSNNDEKKLDWLAGLPLVRRPFMGHSPAKLREPNLDDHEDPGPRFGEHLIFNLIME